MGEKLPYYMVYPMPLAYDDERIERRDYEYMKSLYPDVAKRVLPYVEEECDRMECPCSMMYDEYPDKLQLRMMCSRIYEKVRQNEKLFLEMNDMEIQPETYGGVESQQIRREDIAAESRQIRKGDREDDRRGRRPFRPGQPPKQERPGRGRPEREHPSQRYPQRPDWLRNLIEVMTYQELYKRRQDDRRARRRFY